MLGLSDSSDNSHCDYEPRQVVTKPKMSRAREKPAQGVSYMSVLDEKVVQPSAGGGGGGGGPSRLQDENFSSASGVDDPLAWREKEREEKIDEENSVTFYSSGQQSEENSRAFIESLGSWINDLFSAPSKNPSHSAEPAKDDAQKDFILEEDPEYLKSISAIKEQFRRKLKSETSIQVSAPEKPFLLNFDRVQDNARKRRKSTPLLPSTPAPEFLEEWNEEDDQLVEACGENSIRRYNPNLTMSGLIIRTSDCDEGAKTTKPVKDVNNSILIKERKKGRANKRHDISDLEEYVFPTPSELSKRILLNVKENDKTGKPYKNSHVVIQETAQHYSQRKTKTQQTRCYTTNANDSPRPPKTGQTSQYCTTVATTLRGTDDVFRRNSVDIRKSPRKPSKKEISEITRDSMTFLKMKSQKPMRSVPVENAKTEGRTNSDDLVKYLMKKIKTTRTHNPRHKNNLNVTQLLANPKNRFMQSATNTLVTVMTKNDTNSAVKKLSDTRDPFPGRDLFLKNDVRVDVSRAISNNKYSRLTYLLEDNKVEEDAILLERGSFRNLKRFPDDAHKRDPKKNSSKFTKRQEVKNLLSNIDSKYTVFPEGGKKPTPRKSSEEETAGLEAREEQNARFQKQHELFRTNLKPNVDLNPETKADVRASPEKPAASLSTQLTIIDTNQKMDDTQKDNTEEVEPVFEDSKPDFEYKMVEILDMVEKPEKQEKIFHPKSLDFLKEDSKMMLSPLEKLCMAEQPAQREAKTHETPICPAAELGQVKPAETLLLNRKYSTNTLIEPGPKCKPAAWTSKTPLHLADKDKEQNGDKKEAKEKRKVKSPKGTGTRDAAQDNCGFDKSKKKPGPNCPENE